jgi:hypothetical protein
VAIVRIGQGDSLKMCSIAGDRCVWQRVIHEVAGDLQALDGIPGTSATRLRIHSS